MSVNKDTQVQNVDLNQIVQIGDFGVAELMAMKESIAKKLTTPQFNLFMYQMNRMGLDPSLGHGVPILYGTDVNIRVEYEGYHSLAQKSDGYQGVYRQVVCENETDDFEAETDEHGIITKIRHKIRFPRGKVVGSYAIAKREGRRDVIVLCDTSEFEKYAKANPKFWKLEDGTLDPDMCKKHAATRAVKEQYDIAATVEENMLALSSGDNVPEYKPGERKDITQEAEALNNQQSNPPAKSGGAGKAGPKPVDDGPKPLDDDPEQQPDPVAEAIKAIRTEVAAAFETLGIMTKEDRAVYLKVNAKVKGEAPTLPEYKALLKVMKLHIEEKQFAEAERAAASGDDEPVFPGLE